MVLGGFFLFGVFRVLTRWIELRHRDVRGPSAGELEEVQRQVAELGDLPGRVAELEERLDFAERLLAAHREPGKLPPRKG
jgi:hypothetical protein